MTSTGPVRSVRVALQSRALGQMPLVPVGIATSRGGSGSARITGRKARGGVGEAGEGEGRGDVARHHGVEPVDVGRAVLAAPADADHLFRQFVRRAARCLKTPRFPTTGLPGLRYKAR